MTENIKNVENMSEEEEIANFSKKIEKIVNFSMDDCKNEINTWVKSNSKKLAKDFQYIVMGNTWDDEFTDDKEVIANFFEKKCVSLDAWKIHSVIGIGSPEIRVYFSSTIIEEKESLKGICIFAETTGAFDVNEDSCNDENNQPCCENDCNCDHNCDCDHDCEDDDCEEEDSGNEEECCNEDGCNHKSDDYSCSEQDLPINANYKLIHAFAVYNNS